jgi:hypothetical protein
MTEAKPIPERWRASYSTAGGSHWHDFDWSAKLLEAIEELGAAEAQVETLAKALQAYGQHKPPCDYTDPLGCTCGLTKALREVGRG